jgi:hypothetical protein
MFAQNGQMHREAQQAFGPIWHYAIMQRKRWNDWSRKISK